MGWSSRINYGATMVPNITPIMENQMENEMEAGIIWGIRGIKEFPKIRGTLLGVPIIRTIIYWGLYWGPFILGNYHLKVRDTVHIKHPA